MDASHCRGCYNDFYNGKNPYDVKQCWSLPTAQLIQRKEVPVTQTPPWTQKARKFPSCYRRSGYVYVGADVTR